MIQPKVLVPALQFPPVLPTNLQEVFEAQARCLIAHGIPEQVGVDEGAFLSDAMALASQFTYSVILARFGLTKVVLVHYGVRDRYLCEVGGVRIYTDPDKFTLFDGVVKPEGMAVVQGQFGTVRENTRPCDFRASHDSLEQLGLPVEGLTAFLYYGKPMLEESYMDFPGAVTEFGNVPRLFLFDGDPRLGGGYAGGAVPLWGSVSVSRGR